MARGGHSVGGVAGLAAKPHVLHNTPSHNKKSARQMVRLLADSRYLNATMKPPAAHHLNSCPTQWDMCIRVPTTARFFRAYDIADAFHSCKVAAHCLKYTVVQFGDRFVQYTGGQQGISNLAVFWNVHFQDILDRELGLHWRDWYTIYVDDVGVHGATPEEVMIRSRVLEAILRAYGKTVNSKNSDSPYDDHMILAGLHFDKDGVSLSNKAILSLHDALDAYTVKSLTDQHVVGVIQYASSAFTWPDALPSQEFTDIHLRRKLCNQGWAQAALYQTLFTLARKFCHTWRA